MINPTVKEVDFQRKEIIGMISDTQARQKLLAELEEGWPNLTLNDWYVIRVTIASAAIRGADGPLPEELKQELISQINLYGSSMTKRDVRDVHDQIVRAKGRVHHSSGDIEDFLYGTESIVSTK